MTTDNPSKLAPLHTRCKHEEIDILPTDVTGYGRCRKCNILIHGSLVAQMAHTNIQRLETRIKNLEASVRRLKDRKGK